MCILKPKRTQTYTCGVSKLFRNRKDEDKVIGRAAENQETFLCHQYRQASKNRANRGNLVANASAFNLKSALSGCCKHSSCEGKLHNVWYVGDPAAPEIGLGPSTGISRDRENRAAGKLMVFTDDDLYRSQDVPARHSIAKPDDVVIPLYLGFSTGFCPVFGRDSHNCGTLCMPGLSEYSVLAIRVKATDAISNSLLRSDCEYEMIVLPFANCFLRFRKTVPLGSNADLEKLQEYRLERCAGI